MSTGALLKTLTGHEHVVWSAVGTEAGSIASASADKRVGVWKTTGQKAFSAGHTDSVRSCAALAGGMFATGSNDCTVCIRDPAGHVIRTLVGHDNFVYCVASSARVASDVDASGAFSHRLMCDDATMIASCDENCTVRIWQQSCDFESSAFNVPSTPWSCCFMPNGDVAVGCADQTIRIFTADEARAASEEDLANFKAELSSRTVPMQAVDVSQFPPESALSQPGSRDGQQKIVRNGSGGADAYSWSAADGAWQKIGEVTGSGGAKTEFEGKVCEVPLPPVFYCNILRRCTTVLWTWPWVKGSRLSKLRSTTVMTPLLLPKASSESTACTSSFCSKSWTSSRRTKSRCRWPAPRARSPAEPRRHPPPPCPPPPLCPSSSPKSLSSTRNLRRPRSCSSHRGSSMEWR